MTKRREIDMTEGRIFGKLLGFALPLMLSGLLQSLYNAADSAIIGRFSGESDLAAVGATGSLVNMIVNLFMSMSVGTSITVAIAIGAKDQERTQRLVHTTLAISILFGLIASLVGLFFSKTFLTWMDTPADILDKAALYLKIFFCGSIFSMVYNFGAAILRSAGDSRRPLYFLAISGLVNVGLNLLFVIVFRMAVAGVALATVISQLVSAVMVVVTLMRHPGACRLRLGRIRFHKNETRDIIRTGLPGGIQSLIFSFSNTVIQSGVNSFGTMAGAGNTAANSIDCFIYNALYAYRATAVTAVGQNVGAKRTDRISRISGLCLLQVAVVGILLGGAFYLCADPLLSFFLPSQDPVALDFAMKRLTILTLTYWICGMMDTTVGLTQGLGNTLVPMIVSVCGVCGIRLLWLFTVFPFFHTPTVLFLSYTVTWILTTAAQFILFLRTKHKLERHNEKALADIAQ